MDRKHGAFLCSAEAASRELGFFCLQKHASFRHKYREKVEENTCSFFIQFKRKIEWFLKPHCSAKLIGKGSSKAQRGQEFFNGFQRTLNQTLILSRWPVQRHKLNNASSQIQPWHQGCNAHPKQKYPKKYHCFGFCFWSLCKVVTTTSGEHIS